MGNDKQTWELIRSSEKTQALFVGFPQNI